MAEVGITRLRERHSGMYKLYTKNPHQLTMFYNNDKKRKKKNKEKHIKYQSHMEHADEKSPQITEKLISGSQEARVDRKQS